jgi:hypothetical protein
LPTSSCAINIALGGCVKGSFRDEDVPYRFGGEEFVGRQKADPREISVDIPEAQGPHLASGMSSSPASDAQQPLLAADPAYGKHQDRDTVSLAA